MSGLSPVARFAHLEFDALVDIKGSTLSKFGKMHE